MTREQQDSLPIIYKGTFRALVLELGVGEFSSPNGLSHQLLDLAKQHAHSHSHTVQTGLESPPTAPKERKSRSRGKTPRRETKPRGYWREVIPGVIAKAGRPLSYTEFAATQGWDKVPDVFYPAVQGCVSKGLIVVTGDGKFALPGAA
jgi:hypothetical protein